MSVKRLPYSSYENNEVAFMQQYIVCNDVRKSLRNIGVSTERDIRVWFTKNLNWVMHHINDIYVDPYNASPYARFRFYGCCFYVNLSTTSTLYRTLLEKYINEH